MKVAIIGYGVVGSGVYDILKENRGGIERRCGQSVDVKYVLDIRDFPDHPEREIFVKDFDVVLSDPEVGIVVETMGGVRFAYDYTKRALEAGKTVITSNKELVARYGHEFFEIAERHGCRYLFEASVGGGIPIIRPLARCLAANEIESVTGIINGTTNYILTKMYRGGQSFDDALRKAQELGYAEKDPAADVDGADVCRKIAILASMVLGKRVDCADIPTKGIRGISTADVEWAERAGCSVKLLGRAVFRNGRAGVSVEPAMVQTAGNAHPLGNIWDVYNGILVEGNMVGRVMFYGRGAGKLPTASAVVGDIVDVVRQPGHSGEFSWTGASDTTFDPAELESEFFVRVKETALPAAEKAFADIKLLAKKDGEAGFFTPVMSETEINKRLSEIDGVINKMRIYR